MNSYHAHHARPPTIARTNDREGSGNSSVAGATTAPGGDRSRVRKPAQPETGRLGRQAKLHEQKDTDTEPDDSAKRPMVEEGAHRKAAVAVSPANEITRNARPDHPARHADNAGEEAENNSHDLILHLEGNALT